MIADLLANVDAGVIAVGVFAVLLMVSAAACGVQLYRALENEREWL